MNQRHSAVWRTRHTIDRMFDALPEYVSHVGGPVTRAMRLRWQGRPYAMFDIPDPVFGGEGLSRLMFEIKADRPDLQVAFDTSTDVGRSQLLHWFLHTGRGELGLTWPAPMWQRMTLAENDPRFPEDPGLPISRLMGHLWFGRPEIQKAFPLDSRFNRASFVAWFFFDWFNESEFGSYLQPDWRTWLARCRPGTGMRHDAWLLWHHQTELRKTFPLETATQIDEYGRWFALHGLPTITALQSRNSPRQDSAPSRCFPPPIASGVNLIGYAYGELGIGEDLRMAVACLEQAGVPFSIFNVSPGAGVSQSDMRLRGRVADELPFDINVFCIPGMETVRLFLTHGRSVFDGRYNIGWWPWELPVWPEAWYDAYDLVDEVWAASEYTASAYRRSSPVPVRLVPLAVSVDALTGDPDKLDRRLARKQFGLPSASFLFYFAFDFNSTLARKNPWACLAAFLQAFPPARDDVGLVIKVIHGAEEHPDWIRLRDVIESDDRIRLINRSLRRADLLKLYSSCDCFVSLHRSEGFGRCVAEAMLLGKEVIVSDYSGTVDFAHGPGVHPVPGQLVPIDPADYPGATGREVWFDVDVGAAAEAMQRVAASGARAERAAMTNGLLDARRFSVQFVAAHVASVLADARQAFSIVIGPTRDR